MAEYNVISDFGAVLNAECRDAFVRAAAAVSDGHTVDVPVGEYLIDVSDVAGYVFFSGSGTLRGKNGTPTLVVRRPNADDGIGFYAAASASPTFENLNVVGNRRTGFQTLFHAAGSGAWRLTRVALSDVYNGVKTDPGASIFATDCVLAGIAQPLLAIEGQGSRVELATSRFSSETAHASYINRGVSGFIEDCDYDSAAQYGLHVWGGGVVQSDGLRVSRTRFHTGCVNGAIATAAVYFDDCDWFVGPNYSGLRVNGSGNPKLSHCRFRTPTGTASAALTDLDTGGSCVLMDLDVDGSFASGILERTVASAHVWKAFGGTYRNVNKLGAVLFQSGACTTEMSDVVLPNNGGGGEPLQVTAGTLIQNRVRNMNVPRARRRR